MQVSQATGLAWEDLCLAQLERGWEYLRGQLGHDPEGIRALENSEQFWGWWRMLWARRDEAFLAKLHVHGEVLPRSRALSLYEGAHGLEAILERPFPFIVEQSRRRARA